MIKMARNTVRSTKKATRPEGTLRPGVRAMNTRATRAVAPSVLLSVLPIQGCATSHAGATVEMVAASMVGVPAGIGVLCTTPEVNGRSNGPLGPPIALGLVTVASSMACTSRCNLRARASP